MSALRKAGVWLGFIEDDEDRGYGYDDRSYDDEYPDDELADAGAVVRARVADRLAGARAERVAAHDRASGRANDRRAERHHDRDQDLDRDDEDDQEPELRSAHRGVDSNLRPLARATGAMTASSPSVSYPTRDNLALAPEPQPAVHVAPRVAVQIDDDRRYQITTLHPTTYNEARTIGEHFRDGVPVIMNLTEMAEADAKRLVDFAAGLAFGLRGTMERVTNRVFLLSPANIRVTDEDRAKIAEGGFFFQS